MDEDRNTRITLRLPTELHSKLQKSADKASHSMNAEIIARLGQTYVLTDKGEQERLEELAELIADRVAERLEAKSKR